MTLVAHAVDMTATDAHTRYRFLSYTEVVGDCWNWTGSLDRHGYGRFKVDGSSRAAHRISYAIWVGPLRDGMTVDHLCGNTKCVNPGHLDQVTIGENIRRAWSGNRPPQTYTHKTRTCSRGHEISGDNALLVSGQRPGCRACKQLRQAAARLGISVDQYLANPSP